MARGRLLLQIAWVLYLPQIYVQLDYPPWNGTAMDRMADLLVSPLCGLPQSQNAPISAIAKAGSVVVCQAGPLQDRRNLPKDCKKQLVWKSDPDDHCRSLAIERPRCVFLCVFGSPDTTSLQTTGVGADQWFEGQTIFVQSKMTDIWNTKTQQVTGWCPRWHWGQLLVDAWQESTEIVWL